MTARPWDYAVSNEAGSLALLASCRGIVVKPWRALGCGTSSCPRPAHLRHAHVPGWGFLVAAWIAHNDAGLTMRLYAHSQFVALQDAERAWTEL